MNMYMYMYKLLAGKTVDSVFCVCFNKPDCAATWTYMSMDIV